MIMALIALFLVLFIGEGLILNGDIPTGIVLVVCSIAYLLAVSFLIEQDIFLAMLLDNLWQRRR